MRLAMAVAEKLFGPRLSMHEVLRMNLARSFRVDEGPAGCGISCLVETETPALVGMPRRDSGRSDVVLRMGASGRSLGEPMGAWESPP